MRRARAWCQRILGIFRKERLDRDFAKELESHLQFDIEDGIRSGLSAEEARRQALRRLGGIEPVREAQRDRSGIPVLENLARDLAYAVRTMRSHPGFTAAVILTLALGIGATTAIFTVVNGVLLRPLPYPEPDRLVYVDGILDGSPDYYTYTEDYSAFRDRNRTLSQIAGYWFFQANFTRGDRAERVTGGLATRSLFELLGVHFRLGRNFLPEEDAPGGPAAVILAHDFWRNQFGADPSVIGKGIVLGDERYNVVGVLPADFRLPGRQGEEKFTLWAPFAIDGKQAARKQFFLCAVARLRPGVTIQQATADLQALKQKKLRAGHKHGYVVSPWQTEITERVRASLLIFAGAVACLLLIACVNVANLLLSRAATREKEVAVRRALGAGRGRIIQQLLTESALMGLLGGLFGLALAYSGKDLLLALLAPNLPVLDPILLDRRVLLFNVAVALVTGIGFGLAPALEMSRCGLTGSLKESGRASEGGPRRRLRGTLVVSEVAMATLLLSGAGLLSRSFLRLHAVDPGYSPDHVLTMTVDLTVSKYPTTAAQSMFFQRAIEGIAHVPGVVFAGVATTPPFASYFEGLPEITLEGRSTAETRVFTVTVSPDNFRVLGIPLVQGRYLTDGDRQGAPTAVLVNEFFVRRFYPDGNCLGTRIRNWHNDKDWMTIVGIVRNTRTYPEQDPEPTIYPSYLQEDCPHMNLMVRTAGEPMALAAAVRSAIARVDSTQPPYDITTLEDATTEHFGPRRVKMALVVAFAALALALGAIGIYGVLSYSVRRRTHEIGIRLALGAGQGRMLAQVVRSGLALAAAGIAIGLAGSLWLMRFISSELWGVTPTDPWTFAVVASVVASTAFAACLIPALRAARLDPILALRHE